MAKAFHQRGCTSIKVLDKATSIGGHWAWQPNYVGVGVQNKRDAYRFSDMPMAGHNSPRASAAECVEYLEDYAKKHGFSSKILFGQEVLEVVARPRGPRQTVVARNVATGEQATHSADIVILAAGITPFLPPPAAAAAASSSASRVAVRHSSQLDAALIRKVVDERQRVVVVGGGKSASECVAALRDASHPASLIHCVASSPSTCACFEPQLWPRALQRIILAVFGLSCRLAARDGRVSQWLARMLRWPLFWVGVLVDAPVGGGCWRTLNGQVMTRRLLRLVKGVGSTRGRMVAIGESSVRCSGGEELPADLVVCATGFRIAPPPLYIEEEEEEAGDDHQEEDDTQTRKRQRKRLCDVEAEQPLLYRSMVLPKTPQVSTILYNSMGINAMFSAELMAAWLAHFYASRMGRGGEGGEGGGGGAAASLGVLDLPTLVEADAQPLALLGGGEPFNNWHFWRSGETAGGRGYASDYYEEQIYHDLGMELPSRSLALLRLQHDEEYYRAAAESFEALARGGRRASAGAPRGEV